MSLPALTHTLGGSEAKVPALCSPHWLASPSPAGRNILNSVKNNKHGLININRPCRCQKEKREDCVLLAGASLDHGAAASSLIIWRQPAGSPGPALGPGQAEARPGPRGNRPLGPQPHAGHRWSPTPCARPSSWMEGYVTILLETFRWLPTAHETEPTCPSLAWKSLRLWPQAASPTSCSPVHRLQPRNMSCHFPEMPSSYYSEIFYRLLLFGEGPAFLAKFYFDTRFRHQGSVELAFLAQGAQLCKFFGSLPALSKTVSS